MNSSTLRLTNSSMSVCMSRCVSSRSWITNCRSVRCRNSRNCFRATSLQQVVRRRKGEEVRRVKTAAYVVMRVPGVPPNHITRARSLDAVFAAYLPALLLGLVKIP